MSSDKKVIIAPSILSADFSKLGEEVQSVEKAGCQWIHIDVMDGHFVPNLTIGPVVVKDLRKVTELPLDVHLMIENPESYVEAFAKAGSDWITVHYEACEDLESVRKQILNLGAGAGVSIKPKTILDDALYQKISSFGLILIMTVEPGFGGQSFMEDMVPKITFLRDKGYEGLISVDGGINAETVSKVLEAGADVVVAGSYIFGSQDRKERIASLVKN